MHILPLAPLGMSFTTSRGYAMLEHPALLPQAASQSSGVAQATSSTSNDKVVDNRSGVVHRYSMWSELPRCVCIF